MGLLVLAVFHCRYDRLARRLRGLHNMIIFLGNDTYKYHMV
jgi:hypothetical protein